GSWTLSTTAGTNTLTATSSGLTGSPVTFTSEGAGRAGGRGAFTTAPSSAGQSGVALVQQPVLQLQDANGNPVSQSGVGVTAPAGSAVSSPPSVIVHDGSGNPVQGVTVTFAPAAGSGSVTGGTQTTNGSGIATVGSWTLSTTAGTNTLTAASSGLTGSPVTFT